MKISACIAVASKFQHFSLRCLRSVLCIVSAWALECQYACTEAVVRCQTWLQCLRLPRNSPPYPPFQHPYLYPWVYCVRVTNMSSFRSCSRVTCNSIAFQVTIALYTLIPDWFALTRSALSLAGLNVCCFLIGCCFCCVACSSLICIQQSR